MTRPALFPRFLIVGFVGAHQMQDLEAEEMFARWEPRLRESLAGVLAQLQSETENTAELVAVSSLAANSDTLFAEVVAGLDICHRVFLPQTEDVFFALPDFGTEAALNRSRGRLRSGNVIDVRVTSESPDRRVRFYECGLEIANACDVLIAVYAAGAVKRPGGTLDTLEFARSMGKRVIEIPLEGDLEITETAAKRSGKHKGEPSEFERLFSEILFNHGEKEVYLPAIASLKQRTSALSQRAKNYFQYSAALVVITHVMATVIAVTALVYSFRSQWLVAAKIALLAFGFSLPVYLYLRKPQRKWAAARLVAELCRSVLALRGLHTRLDYLHSLRLPELEWLMQSLEVMHLRGTAGNEVELKDFADAYGRNRMNVQIRFYQSRFRSAERTRQILEWVFYGFSGAALIDAIVYFGIRGQWLRLGNGMESFSEFIPIAFPVIAAACASLISTLDLDRRIERFRAMRQFLEFQRECLRKATSRTLVVQIVNRVEHALLDEVAVWYGKHTYIRGD
jgi:hypothetical protein